MGFPKSALREKQRIIDDYLNSTGRNMFIPAEFLGWLREHPDHPCHDVFFSQSDEAAALEHRKEMVRKWVSGLRLKVRVREPEKSRTKKIRVTEYTVPAMVSPVSLRRQGGGYYSMNMDDPDHVRELATQAAGSLESWLDRFGGVAELKGCDVAAVRQIVDLLRDRRDVDAAA